jgi:hypothetical protein
MRYYLMQLKMAFAMCICAGTRLHVKVYGNEAGSHRSVWFPHGCVKAPQTIRIRDYGNAAHAVSKAFDALKQWERQLTVKGLPVAQLLSASEGKPDLSELFDEPPLPLAWVVEFLYRPLFFAGVGLFEQESGMLWLLTQQARNMARVGALTNVYVLVHTNDRPGFWSKRPSSVQPITCSDWDSGWDEMINQFDKIKSLN